ncbi:hypothetical protein EZJ43_08020 [Pedobacter changchengzhani]|uniref:Large ribosomal subunit protein bL12 C-terminal domain-containing protein n=1 Tax=Pedobacter changchengzhani TaxID=2529274 RepID=A0A4R5MME7_9SPHI|nr:ribosomal protein L7/L12 [Pedobacter changchengzhani]TDG36455.1 hypothetical protein EZJ43_08020 [Pedobacter changchengzhani]
MEKNKITINGAEIDMLEIANLLNQNKKVEAVKLVKDLTNLGLKDAKDMVEAIEGRSLNGFLTPTNSGEIGNNTAENFKETLKNRGLDLAEILKLIEQNKKLEAVKLVHETAKIGLKEAKELVDNLTDGNWDGYTKPTSTGYKESVRVEKNNGDIKVTYTDNNGKMNFVTPNDPIWAHVKKLMMNKELMLEYEQKFNENNFNTTASVFVEERPKTWLWIILAAIILVTVCYFVFNK